jgi:uncharacterized membrane protein
MTHLAAFAGALVAMVVIDSIALTRLLRPMFEREVPHLLAEKPNLVAAAVFYAIYAAGVTWLVIRPGLAEEWGWPRLLANAAVLGVVAYGTFELTSMAVMRGWAWSMVVIDMAWGTLLTALVAAAGFAAARAAGPG